MVVWVLWDRCSEIVRGVFSSVEKGTAAVALLDKVPECFELIDMRVDAAPNDWVALEDR